MAKYILRKKGKGGKRGNKFRATHWQRCARCKTNKRTNKHAIRYSYLIGPTTPNKREERKKKTLGEKKKIKKGKRKRKESLSEYCCTMRCIGRAANSVRGCAPLVPGSMCYNFQFAPFQEEPPPPLSLSSSFSSRAYFQQCQSHTYIATGFWFDKAKATTIVPLNNCAFVHARAYL